MNPDVRHVYRATLLPPTRKHPREQPVRVLETNRLWALAPGRGLTPVAGPPYPYPDEHEHPTGWLALTAGGNPLDPHAYATNQEGMMALAGALRRLALPVMPRPPRAALSLVISMLPDLADQGLGVAVVQPHNITGPWEHFLMGGASPPHRPPTPRTTP